MRDEKWEVGVKTTVMIVVFVDREGRTNDSEYDSVTNLLP